VQIALNVAFLGVHLPYFKNISASIGFLKDKYLPSPSKILGSWQEYVNLLGRDQLRVIKCLTPTLKQNAGFYQTYKPSVIFLQKKISG
jgi:hypothetical protein